MSKEVKAFAPATVANVSCGFDVLGFPIEGIGDKVILKENNDREIRITKIEGVKNLSYDCNKNIVGYVILKILEKLKKQDIGIDIELYKGIETGSGLGSSSASSAAACFAINEYLGNPLSKLDLIEFAMLGEELASGNAHADNVAPAINGAFNLVRSYSPLDVIPFNAPKDLYCTVIHPKIEIKTELSRNILKQNIKLKDAITQWGNIAGLTIGLLKEDYDLISRALKDVLVEPTRSILIPKFNELKEACIETGALGCGISGSGPSVFCLSKGAEMAQNVKLVMNDIYKQTGINFDIHLSKVSNCGAKLID
jgi:homoserine kinase